MRPVGYFESMSKHNPANNREWIKAVEAASDGELTPEFYERAASLYALGKTAEEAIAIMSPEPPAKPLSNVIEKAVAKVKTTLHTAHLKKPIPKAIHKKKGLKK